MHSLLIPQLRNIIPALAGPQAAKKMAIYLNLTLGSATSTAKPMTPSSASGGMKTPRRRLRSLQKAELMLTTQPSANGGTVISCALVDVQPRPLRIVGCDGRGGLARAGGSGKGGSGVIWKGQGDTSVPSRRSDC